MDQKRFQMRCSSLEWFDAPGWQQAQVASRDRMERVPSESVVERKMKEDPWHQHCTTMGIIWDGMARGIKCHQFKVYEEILNSTDYTALCRLKDKWLVVGEYLRYAMQRNCRLGSAPLAALDMHSFQIG